MKGSRQGHSKTYVRIVFRLSVVSPQYSFIQVFSSILISQMTTLYSSPQSDTNGALDRIIIEEVYSDSK